LSDPNSDKKRGRKRTRRTGGSPNAGPPNAAASNVTRRDGDAPRIKKTKLETLGIASASVASQGARSLAITIAIAALEKKALGLEVLDVSGKVDYADFLVLMTGRSDRQVVALAQGIEEEVRKREHKRPLSVEGLPHAYWVLLDFGDVVVHVFQDDARGLYDLDGLWMDARRIPLPIPDGFDGR
jgi:ribosome-associated protein